MSWTDERIQELARLWQDGYSASEIGKRLGVSKNAVVGKAHRLKLPSRPSPIRQGESDPAASADTPDSGPAEAAPAVTRPQPAAKTSRSGGSSRTAKSSAGNGKARNGGTSGTGVNLRAQVEARGGGGSGCLWPIGDPGEPGFHFCGEPSLAGKPYCAAHAARAYITRSRGERDEPRVEPPAGAASEAEPQATDHQGEEAA